MDEVKCTAVNDGLQCVKDEHDEKENHRAYRPGGYEVVWATWTMKPPTAPKED